MVPAVPLEAVSIVFERLYRLVPRCHAAPPHALYYTHFYTKSQRIIHKNTQHFLLTTYPNCNFLESKLASKRKKAPARRPFRAPMRGLIKLRQQESNLRWRSQSPLPYRLAMAHRVHGAPSGAPCSSIPYFEPLCKMCAGRGHHSIRPLSSVRHLRLCSLRMALASIWRTRSRVTPKSRPTSSRVRGRPSSRPKRSRM